MPGFMRGANGGAGMEPYDFRLGDNRGNTFPELTVQPNDDSTAGCDDDPVIDDTGSELDVVADDTPLVGPPCPLSSSLTPVLFLGCSTFLFREF